MVYGWLLAFLLFLGIELVTVNLVSIWFAIGAFVSMILAYFTNNFYIQLLVFIIVSVIALLITKPLAKKLKKTSFVPTNSDRVIGKIGEVSKKITPDNYGEVKVFGNYWTACSKKKIDVGEKVKVIDIEGVKLIVEKEDK